MSERCVSPAQWFAEEWTALLGNVMEAMAGERPRLACRALEGDPAAHSEEIGRRHGTLLWWEQRYPLPGEPSVWIGAPRDAWAQLAARILGAADAEDESQARETYLEVLQQSFGELSRCAGRQWERQLACKAAEATAPPPAGAVFQVQISYEDGSIAPLLVAITGTPQDPPQPQPETPPAQAPASHSEPQSQTLGLLLDVELPVSVSFGHVQLPLQDVLKLTAGSIVELNRSVDELVEVIVNNCVIARGEVVVVEGNYGVRIHQIMTRQQRLESLP